MKKTTLFFIALFSLSTFVFCSPVAGDDNHRLVEYFSSKAVPLASTSDLDRIIAEAGNRKLALLGESSHGTSEFYSWRAKISKRLISEKKFSFIAVEGDWASIHRLNQYVKNAPGALKSAKEVLRSFKRWPEWMWANTDIEQLAEWLRKYNMNLPDHKKVGFYGMDVYGQWEAMDDLLEFTKKYLQEHHPEIQRKVQCFAHYDRDEWMYAMSVSRKQYSSCQSGLIEVVNLLGTLRVENNAAKDRKFFRAEQNALVVKNAEDFFRLAIADNTASWNSRANHMWLSVKRMLKLYGPDSKGIVWAHNTHVGDSDATSMHLHGRVNIGNLSRNELGRGKVFIIGFGTYTGRVCAGSKWGSAMEKMQIPPGRKDSYEDIFSRLEQENFYLLFDQDDRNNQLLNQYRGHRAIGVVYDPRNEAGNYVPTILPQRYDAFIFIRHTNPLEQVR